MDFVEGYVVIASFTGISFTSRERVDTGVRIYVGMCACW